MRVLFVLLILFTLSCKKRDCDILHEKSENAWSEYAQASKKNNSNPTEENKNDAIDKFKIYEEADRDFLERGCYHSKYK